MATKTPNIRLRGGANPVTISGKAYGGDKAGEAMRFPTETRQRAGWYSAEAKRIVRNYGEYYELIPGAGCGGC